MVAERRDPRMVSASGKTCADAAQCGISHRMEHHLPLHGPLRRTGSDLRLALAPEGYGAMVRTAGIQRAVEHPLLRMPKPPAGNDRHRAARHSRRRLHCAERENPGRRGSSFRTSAGYSSPPISTPASSRPTARSFKLPHGHPPDAERGRIIRSADPPDGLWGHSASRFSGNRRGRRRSRSPSARSSRCPCRVRESAAAPHPVRTPA